MALSEVVICCLILSLTLYLVATTISVRSCGGLFRECNQASADNNAELDGNYSVIDGLLLACIIITAISLLCCLTALAVERRWVPITAYIVSFIAFVVALTMEILFHTWIHYNLYSFLTTVATTLCFQVFVVSLADLVPKMPKPEIPVNPDLT
ncbi:hypothetical protein Aperf_G00000012741 [Anoplocephala perfoliata]